MTTGYYMYRDGISELDGLAEDYEDAFTQAIDAIEQRFEGSANGETVIEADGEYNTCITTKDNENKIRYYHGTITRSN